VDTVETLPKTWKSGTRGRLLIGAGGSLLVAFGLFFAFAVPRLTLVNASLVLRYPIASSAGLLVAATGLAIAGLALRVRVLRVIILTMGLCVLLWGVDRYLFQLEAGTSGLSQDGLFGRTTVAWVDVKRVEPGSSIIVVWGKGDAQIRVSTDSLAADDRAVVERTIARHVREARGLK
jgi:hypothetical protein